MLMSPKFGSSKEEKEENTGNNSSNINLNKIEYSKD